MMRSHYSRVIGRILTDPHDSGVVKGFIPYQYKDKNKIDFTPLLHSVSIHSAL